MIGGFSSIKDLIKLNKICIDNNIFQLHYKLTVILLLTFSILVTSKQLIGNPIDCLETTQHIPHHIIDSYCWIFSTSTIIDLQGIVGMDIIKEGVGAPFTDYKEKYYCYYQWVCLVLFCQAILFYMPRYFWKTWEAGKIKRISLDLDISGIKKNEELISDHCTWVTEYFIKQLHFHHFYAYRYLLCEILNLINVIGQFFFIDFFLNGDFFTYGIDVIGYHKRADNKHITDPMTQIFPKLTTCTFYTVGNSGSLQQVDALCILSINIVNEKIYIFLWFWFIILSILSVFTVVYRIIIFFGPNHFRSLLLCARSRISKRKDVRIITEMFDVGDWFILYQLSKNVEPIIYDQLITQLSNELEKTKFLTRSHYHNIQLIMDLNNLGYINESSMVRGKQLDEFTRKLNMLTKDEVKASFKVPHKDMLSILGQAAPCVGFRRSVERLFYDLMGSGHQAMDPLIVTPEWMLTINKYI